MPRQGGDDGGRRARCGGGGGEGAQEHVLEEAACAAAESQPLRARRRRLRGRRVGRSCNSLLRQARNGGRAREADAERTAGGAQLEAVQSPRGRHGSDPRVRSQDWAQLLLPS